MSHTPCYKSRNTNCIGGTFVSADGSRRVIPDHYLNSAKLQSDSTLLRLCYSFCVVDISGYCLKVIFNDVADGKLGTVKVLYPADAKTDAVNIAPKVTSIVCINMSPIAANDLDSRDV